MKLKKPKSKVFGIIFSLKYIYILMIIALLGLAGLLGMFLYQNLYQTITQSEEIVILKQEIAPDTINVKKVEELIDRIEQKKAGQEDIDWSQIKNSFAPAAADIEPAPENLTQE